MVLAVSSGWPKLMNFMLPTYLLVAQCTHLIKTCERVFHRGTVPTDIK